MITKRLLIVDDSPTMRQMLAFTLQGAGYEVAEAENGVAALELLDQRRCDLVIADINMPRMDGITLIQKLREREDSRFTPILVLTTESAPDMKQKGREAGATGWIVKPFNPERLLQIIVKVL